MNIKQLKKVKLLKKFFNRLNSRFDLEGITINKVHMFGKRIGFIDLTAKVKDQEGNSLPGICMLRGNSVGILTVLISKETAKEYFVLTHQPRIPVADYIYEIPAGMVDGGDVKTKAFEELNEEVGVDLKAKSSDLIYLDSSYTSPGLLDEEMTIYLFRKVLSQKKIDKINNRASGLDEEQITTVLVSSEDFLDTVQSFPSKCAFYAYKNKIL